VPMCGSPHVARHGRQAAAWAPPWSAWMRVQCKHARPCESGRKENFVGVVAEKHGRRFRRRTSLGHVDSRRRTAKPHGLYDYHAIKTHARHLVGQFQGRRTKAHGSSHGGEATTTIRIKCMFDGQLCAVATCKRQATIWSPRRCMAPASTSAMILGLKPEDVHIIFRRGSGCYGINGADTVHLNAALLSQAWASPSAAALPKRRNGGGELRASLSLWTSAPGSTPGEYHCVDFTKRGHRPWGIGRGTELLEMSSPDCWRASA